MSVGKFAPILLAAAGVAAADLRRGVPYRLASGFDGAAADQCFQSLARQGGDGIGERAVEAPTRMGRLQAHVDRLNSPHPCTNMGMPPPLFNAGACTV